jgi:hypothetical protein
LHLGERLRGRFSQHGFGDRVELLAHKVVLRRVADVEVDAGDLYLQIHQLLRRIFGDSLEVEVLVFYDLEAVLVLGDLDPGGRIFFGGPSSRRGAGGEEKTPLPSTLS